MFLISFFDACQCVPSLVNGAESDILPPTEGISLEAKLSKSQRVLSSKGTPKSSKGHDISLILACTASSSQSHTAPWSCRFLWRSPCRLDAWHSETRHKCSLIRSPLRLRLQWQMLKQLKWLESRRSGETTLSKRRGVRQVLWQRRGPGMKKSSTWTTFLGRHGNIHQLHSSYTSASASVIHQRLRWLSFDKILTSELQYNLYLPFYLFFVLFLYTSSNHFGSKSRTFSFLEVLRHPKVEKLVLVDLLM